MIQARQIKKANEFPIIDLLDYFGFQPCENRGNEYVYFSPFRNEKTPSFFVNVKKNVTKDFGDQNNSGDAIRLYMNLTKKGFIEAVNDLNNNKIRIGTSTNFSYEPIKIVEKKKPEIVLIKDKIENKNLIHYLNSRKISIETANLYCKEIHYKQPNGKVYYGIGFGNNSGGYEIRSADFKSCLGNKDITTILNKNLNDVVLIFEGFFDFMSFIELKNPKPLNQTYLILNSNSLINKLKLENSFWVNCYLNNDKSGIKATQKIKDLISENCVFRDWSEHYKTDLNDYLVKGE